MRGGANSNKRTNQKHSKCERILPNKWSLSRWRKDAEQHNECYILHISFKGFLPLIRQDSEGRQEMSWREEVGSGIGKWLRVGFKPGSLWVFKPVDGRGFLPPALRLFTEKNISGCNPFVISNILFSNCNLTAYFISVTDYNYIPFGI